MFGVREGCTACIFHSELQPVHSSDMLMPTDYPTKFTIDSEMNLQCYKNFGESLYKLTFLKTNLTKKNMFCLFS